MKPNFPLKNLAINELIEFRSAAFIFEYTQAIAGKSFGGDEIVNDKLDFIHTVIKRMADEINQTIFTSNDNTKIALFEELKKNISDHGLFVVDTKEILLTCHEWNSEKNKEFEKKIDENTVEYFSNPAVNEHGHLEVYTRKNRTPSFLRFGRAAQKDYLTFTNYKFYTIEEEPGLIDYAYVNAYVSKLHEVTSDLKNTIEPLIKRYDDGKIVLQSQNPTTTFDTWVTWLKNNKVIAGVLILVAVLTALFTLINQLSEASKSIEQGKNLFIADSVSTQKPFIGGESEVKNEFYAHIKEYTNQDSAEAKNNRLLRIPELARILKLPRDKRFRRTRDVILFAEDEVVIVRSLTNKGNYVVGLDLKSGQSEEKLIEKEIDTVRRIIQFELTWLSKQQPSEIDTRKADELMGLLNELNADLSRATVKYYSNRVYKQLYGVDIAD